MTMNLRELLPILAPLLGVQLILTVIALTDLFRREAERVRGPKWVWAIVSVVVATLGPIAYLVFGRKD